MLAAIIVILAVLWVLGYLHIGGINFPDTALFTINNQTVSIIDLMVFLIVLLAIGMLPSPFREISGVLLLLWLLAVLGVISIVGVGLPAIFMFALIIGLIVSLINSRRTVL
jgi:hypothetical protein